MPDIEKEMYARGKMHSTMLTKRFTPCRQEISDGSSR